MFECWNEGLEGLGGLEGLEGLEGLGGLGSLESLEFRPSGIFHPSLLLCSFAPLR